MTGGGSLAFWEERYRRAAADGDSLWGAAPNGWIAEQAGHLQPGRALDLGAGEGRNALWLAGRGWSVTAVDFSAGAAALLRAAAGSLPIEVAVADATAWTGAPVDLAVLCYLQLDPQDLAAAIGRAAGALVPGGTLLGIWHDREDVARGLGGAMSPTIRTTPEETAEAARAAGLDIRLSGRRDRPVADSVACDTLLVAGR